jgi:penicillin G amidase
MWAGRRRSSWHRRAVSTVCAAAVSAVLLWVLAAGFGAIPPLGPALDAGRGAWASAAGGQLPASGSLDVPGLQHPVSVSYTAQGVASIRALSDHDLFLALGYVHARFRLAEMDEERRLGEGRLAQLAGPSGLASDEFELRLGLLRTAQEEWAQTPRSSPAGQALLAYAQGVNDDIAQVRADGDWPAVFSLAHVYPSPWTPVDSLAIQGVLTQELDFTTTPLDYSLLEKSLGASRTMAWFPVIPANAQNPYDPGPYQNLGLTPLAPDAASTAGYGQTIAPASESGPLARRPAGAAAALQRQGMTGGLTARGPGPCARVGGWCHGGQPAHVAGRRPAPGGSGGLSPRADTASSGLAESASLVTAAGSARAGQPVPSAVTAAAGTLLAQISRLPAGLVHREPDSNAWAANGPAVAGGPGGGGGAMLAGDPHLPQTLPSIWYEAALSAPGLAASGVTVPGVPGVLIGHNQHIAWSLTDTQNQAALFYAEQTSSSHPGQYYWRGAWRPMQTAHYTIGVRGGSPVHLTVGITVHGPIMTQAGQTMAVDWMGNVPSPDLTALLGVDEAANFSQFRAALAGWRAPSQNFVYADDRGNIGVISAGYYPQVAHGDPWLPLPGTGADDIVGVIPYAAVPQVYDPPAHVVATANQRPVGPSYPYYIGTSADFFDNGFRAGEIYSYLRGHAGMTPASFAALQGSVTDNLAGQIVPELLAALRQGPGTFVLSGPGKAAMSLLARWNDSMTAGSAAASVWWTFWGDYISAVFGPWWTWARVPVGKDPAALALSSWPTSLTEDLSAWTLGQASGSAFSLPSGGRRTAAQVMRAAFGAAVTHLEGKLGRDPARWTWGRLHTRYFPSLTGAAGLGYGPRAASGDAWTVNAAEGGLESGIGPSWRMIVDFTGPGAVTAEGVYPGGQSENPASPWYADLIADWWDGRYLPMPAASGTGTGGRSIGGTIRWSLRPAPAGAAMSFQGAGNG